MRMLLLVALLALVGCEGGRWLACKGHTQVMRVCEMGKAIPDNCLTISMHGAKYRVDNGTVHWKRNAHKSTSEFDEGVKISAAEGVFQLKPGHDIVCDRFRP